MLMVLLEIPEWLGTALAGAALASLGYVAKIFIELYQSLREKRNTKRSKLIELQSLLRATRVAFEIQNQHAQDLSSSIKSHLQEFAGSSAGYEEIMANAFRHLNDRELELHSIIRSITINTLYPLNKRIMRWLRKDIDFRSTKSKDPVFSQLAPKLVFLEVHLLLWIAKYEAWIPDHEEHALVYMADEKRHGLGFPERTDEFVDKALLKF